MITWTVLLPRLACGTRSGQGSVEYALVLVGLIALGAALASLTGFFDEGGFEQRFLESLTHRLSWGVLDVLSY